MSAWFVFASLGFYPLAGSTTYILGSPLFTNATIELPSSTITIIAHDNSPSNIYVNKILVNGKTVTTPFIEHSQLVEGNTVIEYFMTNQPSKTFM